VPAFQGSMEIVPQNKISQKYCLPK